MGQRIICPGWDMSVIAYQLGIVANFGFGMSGGILLRLAEHAEGQATSKYSDEYCQDAAEVAENVVYTPFTR